MNLSQLRAKMRFMYNAPYTDAQATALLNEAQQILSEYFHVEQHWFFKTEAGVDEYDLYGLDVSRIISLGVSRTADPVDRYDYYKYKQITRDDYPRGARGYYQVPSTKGAKRLILYPVPQEDDLIVSIRYTRDLADLTLSTDVPEFDPNHHMLLVYYALQQVCARSETPDTTQADYYAQQWDNALAELKRSRLKGAMRHARLARDNRHWHKKQGAVKSSTYQDVSEEH